MAESVLSGDLEKRIENLEMRIPSMRRERQINVRTAFLSFIAQHPLVGNANLYKKFPEIPQSTIRGWKHSYYLAIKSDENILAHLKWLYNLMATKTIKGIPASKNENIRLKVIEKIIGVR